MSYHPRFERTDVASFLTSRSRNQELWFVNNPRLEEAILGYAAKFSERYTAKPYALAMEGNHLQAPAFFPLGNRSDFMRDFNACTARAVNRYVPTYPGGIFWGRRFSAEVLPLPQDIEEYFFYTVLQPVQDGLVERISDYPGYNCFHDAIHGITRKFKVVNWGEYNAKKRYNPKVKLADYTEYFTLKYERLPGYEDLSQSEYARIMLKKLEEHRLEAVRKRRELGLGFAGPAVLRSRRPGARPINSKKSSINDHRPRVLSSCNETRALEKQRYFENYFAYKEASRRYRAGEVNVEFPKGTYKPNVKVKLIDPDDP